MKTKIFEIIELASEISRKTEHKVDVSYCGDENSLRVMVIIGCLGESRALSLSTNIKLDGRGYIKKLNSTIENLTVLLVKKCIIRITNLNEWKFLYVYD